MPENIIWTGPPKPGEPFTTPSGKKVCGAKSKRKDDEGNSYRCEAQPKSCGRCRKHGGNTKRNESKAELFLKAYGAGLTKKDAAAYAGVDQMTPIHWAKADPEFAVLMDQARAENLQKHIENVQYAAFGYDVVKEEEELVNGEMVVVKRVKTREFQPNLSKWYLEVNGGMSPKSQVDLTSDGKAVQTVLYIPDNGRDSNQAEPTD